MAYRGDDREYYPRRPRSAYDDIEVERRQERRSPPPFRRAPFRESETDVSIRERDRVDRTPAFLREDVRRTDAGPLVLRSREVETVDRRRPRSPSPSDVRVRERVVERRRSPSVPPLEERMRARIVERERSPAPPRPRFIPRSPSPPPPPEVRVDTRIIEERERRRPRSPTPERERIRIVQRERERVPSPSPSPSPPPAVVRPKEIIEREVITHYRDIDHGVERVRVPSPPPPPRPIRAQERETDIDINIGRNDTEVDIHRSRSRTRSRPPAIRRPSSYDDDELILDTNRNRLTIEQSHRRSRSAAPARPDYSEEAEYITSTIDSRGRMGEAWNGATRDWTIVDVPPGTERVKMDGVGGGGAEVTWQRYNGVRRSKFIPERDESVTTSTTSIDETIREPVSERDRLSVQIYDSHRDKSRDRSVVEDVRDTRISIRDRDRDRKRRSKKDQMWTEITKDLVVREAIEQLGYEYEETEWFFYVMQYLRYEDVLELVNLSDSIRRARRERAREIEWEREMRDRRERKHRNRRWDRFDDERIVEREVVFDRPPRGYIR